MDGIAATEAKAAQEENERLKNDPTATIPEEVDRRCLKTIHRGVTKKQVHSAGRVTAKALKRDVMVAGIAAILFTTAFAASETVRVNTLNLIVEVFDTNTTFRFTGDANPTSPQCTVGWVPEGYALVKQGHDELSTWYRYEKSEEESVTVRYHLSDGLTLSVDTEDAQVKYIDVNGKRTMWVQKGSEHQFI